MNRFFVFLSYFLFHFSLSEATFSFSSVPAGIAWLGDMGSHEKIAAFSIGTYPVTNQEFSIWLTQAVKKGTAIYADSGENLGNVTNQAGELLFLTLEGNMLSQIMVQKQTEGDLFFKAVPGKEHFPVIFVSYLGALQFCQESGFRLPKEIEWEMAASIPKGSSKKFLFGCSTDVLQRELANYNDLQDLLPPLTQALTTQVGFYNGKNLLSLRKEDHEPKKTKLALSPYGAYDMSGNVWEWVTASDAQNPNKRLAKGGCYDSYAESCKVNAKIWLQPNHVDAYTGFRAAKTLIATPNLP